MTTDPETTPGDTPGVAVFPPLLFGLALAAGLLLGWPFPAHLFAPGDFRLVLGIGLMLAGIAFGFPAVRRFKAAGTNVNPMQPSTAFVATGPYRWSRNPMYVGFILLYVGLGVLTNSVWMIVMLVPVLFILRKGVILREERYLSAKFGDPYRAYCRQVRRWL